MGLGIAALALLVLLAGALLTTRDEGASTASTAETAQTGKTSETPFGPPSDAPRALAILPLQDLAMEGTARPLGLGLADALRTELGRNPSLRVLARSSSMAVAREAQDARSVGAHFGIDAVLEGSVVQHPERVTVNLSLSDARDGWQRWSESFEGSPDALFEMNRRIVQRVSLALDPTPAPRDGAPEAPEGHAYTLYLQGLHHLGLRGEDGLQRADALLREALALDPEFGAARVALARTLVLTPYWTELGEHEAFPPALELLDERSYGDPLLRGTVAGIRGFVHFRRWEWSAARREFATALQLVPQDAGIRAWYAQYLAAVGELEASLAEARESWALDPGSPIVGSRVAIAELWLGRPRAAARYYDTTDAPDLVRRDPSYLIYLLAVEEDETVAGLLHAVHAAEGLDTDWVPACIGLIRGTGNREALLARYSAAVENGEVLPRLQFAIWILAGEYERATAFVETHLGQRRLIDVEFAFAAQAEGYRADPSFERMLRLIGHPALAQ